MSFEDALTERGEGCIIDVYVQPGSKGSSISYNPWRKRLEVSIKAEPRQGKANRELLQFFSKIFGCGVELLAGAKSRNKRIYVAMSREEVIRRLSNHL